MSLLDLIRSTNFAGNMWLLNQEDPMDTREDYDGFGLVGSDQSAWVYQQIILPALLALGQPFEVPAWAPTFVRGRVAGFAATQLAPPPPPTLAPPPPPPAAVLPAPPPPPPPTMAPPPPPPSTDPFAAFLSSASPSRYSSLPAPPAPPKRDFRSKFGADLATNFNIGSGSIR
ncbi:hypothetical protein VTL71DRAFT_13509 [Oculimacula yallundae]|uniref:Uncharacterized protein n=1 Tax=Oculimacula yallundae TaxID=86028 RepID=A0ABR4CKP2_9HELO